MKEQKYINLFLSIILLLATILTVGRIIEYQQFTTIKSHSIKIPKEETDWWDKDEEEEVDDFEVMVRQESKCLAENIYHEARNQSTRGQLAVASVTMNRVYNQRFPNDVCSVVYQKNRRGCQFTWLCKGRKVDPRDPLFQEKYELAQMILKGEIRIGKLNDALYYHTTRVRPWWAGHMEYIGQIEDHKFYTERET
jgi:spore germination cell wall hydrolase CwlJ-like protein